MQNVQDETWRFDPNDIAANRGIACLSYLSLLILVPILTRKNSPFTRFHINQGLIFIILSVLSGVISAICRYIPFVGGIISTVVSIAMFVLFILGFVNALLGKATRLPIVGNVQLYR